MLLLHTLALLNSFSLAVMLKFDCDALEIFGKYISCTPNNVKNVLKLVDANLLVVSDEEGYTFQWSPTDVLQVLEREGLVERAPDLIPTSYCISDEKCIGIIEDLLVRNEPIPWKFYENKFEHIEVNRFSEDSRGPLLDVLLEKHFEEYRDWSLLSGEFLKSGRWRLWNYVLLNKDINPNTTNVFLEYFPKEDQFEYAIMVISIYLSVSQEKLLTKFLTKCQHFPPDQLNVLKSANPFEHKELVDQTTLDHQMAKERVYHSVLGRRGSFSVLYENSNDHLVKSSIIFVHMKALINLHSMSMFDGLYIDIFKSLLTRLDSLNFESIAKHSKYITRFYSMLERALKFKIIQYSELWACSNILRNLFSWDTLCMSRYFRQNFNRTRNLSKYMRKDDDTGVFYFDRINKKTVRNSCTIIYVNTIASIKESQGSNIQRPHIDESFYEALFNRELRTKENNQFITRELRESFEPKRFWKWIDSGIFYPIDRVIAFKILSNKNEF